MDGLLGVGEATRSKRGTKFRVGSVIGMALGILGMLLLAVKPRGVGGRDGILKVGTEKGVGAPLSPMPYPSNDSSAEIKFKFIHRTNVLFVHIGSGAEHLAVGLDLPEMEHQYIR